jgi:DegV family protein with EDD domain
MTQSRDRSIRILTRAFLQQSVIAGARRVITHRDHLDRINVFPVPDHDTGTNLALTMAAIVDGLRRPLPSLDAVSSTIASSALTGAQGNSGVIFAQFFQGLREGFSDSVQVSVQRFAEALRRASTRAREALAQPREGTILTVISDVADHLSRHAERLPDFRALLDEGLRVAKQSLTETTNRLAVLKQAGVVDAGALGFVHFLEGIRDFFSRGGAAEEAPPPMTNEPSERPPSPVPQRLDFRYCVEAVVRGERIPQREVIERLSTLGDSVVVAGTDTEIHAHVHSNVPAYVLALLAGYGEVGTPKVEDMLVAVADQPTTQERSGIALVTDSACDLPMEILTERRVHVVPVRLAFGDEVLLDRVDITPAEFYARLTVSPVFPKTSQPRPIDFLTLYKHLAQTYEGIVSVHLSTEVSGTWQSAQTAARQVSEGIGVPIEVVDCRSASAAEGLVVWAASRAIEARCTLADCAEIARETAQRTYVYVYVPTVEYFVRGGRLSPMAGRLAKLLHLCPVLSVEDGRIVPAGKALGTRAAQQRVLNAILRHARGMDRPTFVVSQSAAPQLAEEYRVQLLLKAGDACVWSTDTAPAIGSHAGPGAAAIAVTDASLIDRAIEMRNG